LSVTYDARQTGELTFIRSVYGRRAITAKCYATDRRKRARLESHASQFLYRHRNGRYYVRTFAGGKEKWTSLKTKLLTVARNRMKDHVDAADEAADDRQHLGGRWAAHLWRGHHDLQRATRRGRDPAEHKGVPRGRLETCAPILGGRGGAQCPPHNVKNGRRMASPL
jgi:hypothetical protein